jgi:hypothetical protein
MRQFGILGELVVDRRRRRRSGTQRKAAVPAASLGVTAGVGVRKGVGGWCKSRTG